MSTSEDSPFTHNYDPSMLTPFKNIHAAGVSLRQISEDGFYIINEIVTKRLGHIPILKVTFFKKKY